MRWRVVVAEEHLILRAGLRSLLQQADVDIVGEAATGLEAVRLTRRLTPDLVLLDIDIPELNTVEVIREIVASHPAIRILVMSLHAGARLVEETLKMGAAGYLGDDCDFAQLKAAIDAVMAGQTYLTPTVTKVVVGKYLDHSGDSASSPFSRLTSREREVLQLMAQGQSIKQIAMMLHRSGKTIETHRQQLMRKLNVSSVAELTKCAIREGLTSLEQ